MADRRPLLSLDEVLAKLRAGAAEHRIAGSDADIEAVSTFDALGRVLAEDVTSLLDVPPADNTSMDGYAVAAADVAAPGTVLPVAARVPAGVVGAVLARGTAARIFTGAQVPDGADAVVMQEQCESLPEAGAGAASGGFGAVRINADVQPGQWIRRRGEDVQRGAIVLARGTRLSPQAMGLAASVGAGELKVLRRPRVAVFSTGDELRMPGEPLPPGAIYNSNRFTLRGLLQAAGCAVTDLGIVPDRLDATVQALATAAASNDLILTSGGVSAGEEDHVRPAVESLGRIENWQVAIKPGKPLAFGAVRRDDAAGGVALFIGLPGNPVSGFVNFLLAVAPVLRVMQGMSGELPAAHAMIAAFDWPMADKRREFLRVRHGAEGALELFPNQSSGVLTSAVWGDGLVDNPPGQIIRRGDRVWFRSFAALIGG